MDIERRVSSGGLTTPAGPDKLLAERVKGTEGLDEGFRLEITALSTDADIELKTLLGQPALLELQTAASRTELRPFHGHITAIEQIGANGETHQTFDQLSASVAGDEVYRCRAGKNGTGEERLMQVIRGKLENYWKSRGYRNFMITETERDVMGATAIMASLAGMSGQAAATASGSRAREQADFVSFTLDGK